MARSPSPTSEGGKVARDTFGDLSISYPAAYSNNHMKEEITKAAIELLSQANPNTQICVLDVGCGNGNPVSKALAKAGFSVKAFDVSAEMIKAANASGIEGTFFVDDMITYQPADDEKYAGIFMIFVHLQMDSYAKVCDVFFKFAQALKPEGLLVVGQMPADEYIKKEPEKRTWVENYNAPFMGKPLPTFMMTAEAQKNFLISMGLEFVDERKGVFKPGYHDPELQEYISYEPEQQQYIIMRRPTEKALKSPSLPQITME